MAAGRMPSGRMTRRPRTTRSGRNKGFSRSEPEQVQLDLLVPMVARPQIERRPRHFIDQRHGESQPRQVDALDVSAAGFAAVNPQMIEVGRLKLAEVTV